MKKLLPGILKFRANLTEEQRANFAQLALGQSPDALLIGCSDSRVVPDLFASTDPGDLFVVRNVGNLIPPHDSQEEERGLKSESAAIEFALGQLGVNDIIVCGHSQCGAMNAICGGLDAMPPSKLRSWLTYGNSFTSPRPIAFDESMPEVDRLSQINVLRQIENLRHYPIVRDHLNLNRLKLHAWWFDIARAEVHGYDDAAGRFVPIDEAFVAKMQKQRA